MTRSANYLILLIALLTAEVSFAQTTSPVNAWPGGPPYSDTLNCEGTPTFEVDLTGQPGGIWLSDPQQRDGDCCSASDDNCVQFQVTLDANAEGILFTVPDGCGASPSGSLFYQVDCGPLVSVGTPLCLSGTGPFTITFCKPGNNENCYSIESIPAPSTNGDVLTADGCVDTLSVSGLDPTTVTWSSIPQNDGLGNPQPADYFNDLLSALDGSLQGTSGVIYDQDQTIVLVTPGGDYPPTITYEVCGSVIGACSSADYCGLASVTIYPTLFADAGPDVAFCLGSTIAVTSTGTAIGGTSPYTFTWEGISGNGLGFNYSTTTATTTADVDFNLTGEYEMTILDVTGCPVAIDTVNVYEYQTAIQSFINTASSAICFDITDPISLDGYVTETYTGEWSASPNVGTFSSTTIDGTATAPANTPQTVTWTPDGVTTGQVTLTLTPTNNLGCPIIPASITIDLTEFTPGALAVTPTNVSCFGGSDGALDLAVAPGTPNNFDGTDPFGGSTFNSAGVTYAWDLNGAAAGTTQDIASLPAGGVYSVTVTDENGCTETVTPFTITEPPVLNATVTPTPVTCFGANDGILTVTAPTGGYGTYEYSLDGTTYQAGNTFSNLVGSAAPGTSYTVWIQDAANPGCEIQLPAVFITEPPVLNATVTPTPVTCFGANDGILTVTAPTGGYGTYEYSLDGTTYQAGNTFSNLVGSAAPGTSYTVWIQDAANPGCEIQLPAVFITEPPVLNATVTPTPVTCFGANDGILTVTAPTGGYGTYEYSLDGTTYQAGNTFSNLVGSAAPGTSYTVWIQDAANPGCEIQLPAVFITEPPVLNATVTPTPVTCFGANDGILTVTAPTGGYGTYEYSLDGTTYQAGNTFSNLVGSAAPGTSYTVWIQDAANPGCEIQLPAVFITEPPVLNATVTPTPVTCFGANDGILTVTAPTGGYGTYEYSLDGTTYQAGNTFSNLVGSAAPGTSYTVWIQDAANPGCEIQLPAVFITEPPVLNATVTPTPVTCFGANDGILTVTAPTGGYGTYEYSLDGTTYQAGNTFSNLVGSAAPGTSYTVWIQDAANPGCEIQLPAVFITEPPVLNATVTPTPVTCFGANDGILTVTAPTGGYGTYEYSLDGTTYQAGNTFSNLVGSAAPGTSYTVWIQDAANPGCEIQLPAVFITEPPVLNATVTPTPVTCFGANDGILTVTAPTGGYGTYEYSLDGTTYQAGNTFSNLVGSAAPGTSYTVWIQDAANPGCEIQLPAVFITEPPVLNATVTPTPVTCFGANDGILTVTAPTGGYGTYEYSLDGTTYQAGNTFSNLVGSAAPGTSYTVWIQDAANPGCEIQLPAVFITEPPVLNATVTPTPVTCFGANDGILTVTAPTGGYGTYEYSLDGTTYQAGNTFSNLVGSAAPGTSYTVWIQDAANPGCEIQLPAVFITEPPVLNATVTPTPVTCFGANDGILTVTAPTGGYGTYEYSLDGTTYQAGNTFSNLVGSAAPGTSYTVWIQDAANPGCEIQLPAVFITEPPVLNATVTPTPVTCFGANDGILTVTAPTGGYGTYEYSLDGTTYQAGNTFSNLVGSAAPGTSYTVWIQDAANPGCEIQLPAVFITQPDLLTTTATSTLNYNTFGVSCGDISVGTIDDGAIEATTSGGIVGTGYTYLWTTADGTIPGGQETSQTPTGLTTGTYDVLVTDANGCTTTDQIIVTEPIILSLDAITPSVYAGGFNLSGCNPDGTIDIDVSAGVAPYTFAWTGPAGFTSASEDLTTLAAGTYDLTVTDANGCVVTGSITLTEPSGLGQTGTSFVYPNGDNISCFGASDGSIDITTVQGTPTYSYSWTDGAGFTAATEDISGVTAGTYTLVITDANGCISDTTITLTEPPLISVTSLVTTDYTGFDVTCTGASDGGLGSTPAGGAGTLPTDYTYSWDTNPASGVLSTDQNPTGLPAGDYTVTVTDINGCQATSDITITEPTPVVLAIDAFTNETCDYSDDATIDLSATGGTGTFDFEITAPTLAGPQTGTTASFGTLTGDYVGNGGIDYTLLVTDQNGCTSTLTQNITQPDPLIITVDAFTNETCDYNDDGTINVSAIGGTGAYDFNIIAPITANSGAGTFTGLTGDYVAAGGTDYTIEVTDASGCTHTVIQNITQPDPLVITVDAFTNETCDYNDDATITVSATGGTTIYDFDITAPTTANSGAGTFTGLTGDYVGAGGTDYTIEVSDAQGCVNTIIQNVTQPDPLTTTTSNTTDYNTFGVSCGDISVGTVDDGGIDATPAGGTIGTGYTYLWTGTGTIPAGQETLQNPTGLTTGTYDVLVTDANGCTTTDQIIVTEPTILSLDAITPSVYAGGFNLSGCFPDGTLDLDISQGVPTYTYAWTGPNGYTSTAEDITGLAAGTYDVTITDNNGCTVTGQFVMTEPSGLGQTGTSFVYPNGDNISCFGLSDGSIDITTVQGTPAYSYSWTDGAGYTAATEDISGVPAGTYTLTITDANGCTSDTTITLTEPPLISVTSLVTTDYTGFDVTCTGASDGGLGSTPAGGAGTLPTDYTYSWDTNPASGVLSTDQNPTGLPAGDYTVTVTDINGCQATSDITITEPTPVVLAIDAFTNETCDYSDDATIDLSATGGTGTFDFEITAPTLAGPQTGTTASFGTLTGDYLGNGGIDYTLLVTDQNGCTSTLTQNITQPDPLIITVDAFTNETCDYNDDGTINVSAIGGTGAYDFNIIAPITANSGAGTFTGLTGDYVAAGGTDYTIEVTDASGCTHTVIQNITQPDPLVITVDAFTNETCDYNDDATITVSATGGTTIYDFDITAPTTANSGAGTFTGLTGDYVGAGGTDYTIEVSDAQGCVNTIIQNVTQPDPLTTTTSNTTDYNTFGVSCGDISVGTVDDGGIDATPAGGTIGTGYTYLWTGTGTIPAGQETLQNPTGLTTGTYDVLVTDANGCTTTDQIIVTEPTILSLDAITPSVYAGGFNLSGCFPDGTLDLDISQGVPTYTYAWTGPNGYTSTAEDITGLAAGTYDVTITDNNGCTVTGQFVMTEPPTLTQTGTSFIYPSGDNISCFGASDGSIDITTVDGTPAYSYSWTDGAGYTAATEDISGVPAGTYTLTITDANGCTSDTTITLVEPTPLFQTSISFAYPSGDNISCFGFADGSIDYTPGGGSPNVDYVYSWTALAAPALVPAGQEVLQDPAGLTAGDYNVMITDMNGCSLDTIITLVEPTPLVQSSTSFIYPSGDNISCFGLADGSIDYTPGGGSPGYTYLWTAPAAPATVPAGQDVVEDPTGLTAGDYVVTITDINGCVLDTTITLVEPTPLAQASTSFTYPSGDNISCFGFNDGSIDYTPAGGSPNYVYTWSGPNGFTSGNQDITNLFAGDYTVTITDINGCSIDSTITLVEPIPLTQTSTSFTYPSGDNISCFGFNDGSIDYTPGGGSPGYTFAWSGPGGFTGSTEDIGTLFAGSYDVTITDINGCVLDTTIVLSEPTPLTESTILSTYPSGDNISCFGASDGSIDLTNSGGSPGYTFSWIASNGGTIPAGQNTQEDLTGLLAGTYTVDATDINGCVITTIVDLVQPTEITSLTAVTSNYNGYDVSCAGASDGAVTVTANGGSPTYVYEWFDATPTSIANSQDATNIPPGDYEVLITDINGCTHTDVITVNDAPPLQADILSVNDFNGYDISCYGASDGGIDLTVIGGNPGYTFTWVNGDGVSAGSSEDLTGLIADEYCVHIEDLNGCAADTCIELIQPEPLDVVPSVTTNYNGSEISCYGASDGALDAVGAGGVPVYTYTWYDASGGQVGTGDVLQGITAGTYFVEILDANGCTFQTDILITEPTPVTADITILTDYNGYPISCSGAEDGAVSATATGGTPGGYNYLWDTSPPTQGQTAEELGEGTYTVTIVDVNGCIGTEDVFLQGNPLPVVNPGPSIEVCQGEIIEFGSFSAPEDQCHWELSNGMEIDDCGPNIIYFETPGCIDATLTVTGPLGCVDSLFIEDYICILSNPIADFYAEPWQGTIIESIIDFQNTSVGADYYSWDFGDNSAPSTDENPQHDFGGDVSSYGVTLIAYSLDGCSDTITEYINIKGEIIFYVPNTFTPDGDDYNEFFKPVFYEAYLPEGTLFQIFNRWGELVYEADEYAEILAGWDGTYKGNICQDGTYTWKLYFKDKDTDKKEIHTGHVNIIR